MRREWVVVGLPVAGILVLATCSKSGASGSGGATSATGAGAGVTSGAGASGAVTSTGAGPGSTTSAGSTSSAGAGGGMPAEGASVLQYHKTANRNGVTVDAAFTKAAAMSLHADAAFHGAVQGAVYAQPLFVDGQGGKDLLLVVTEKDWVYALDGATGAAVWSKQLGTAVSVSSLPCGNISPLGITGTPIVDLASRTMYLDAMTTPDMGTTVKHEIFALSIDDGSTKPGWPVDANATFKAGALTFDSKHQNQRGALALLNGTLYVPYGGHAGDCLPYHGWVVGIPVANPAMAHAFATAAEGGGVWAPGGLSSDGTSIFAATGNTFNATTFGQGESLLRIGQGAVFSGQSSDFFAPTNWKALDTGDVDIGGSGPLVVDAPGTTPSALLVGLGKDGKIYVVDRANMGGISSGLAAKGVASNEIINGASAYTTPAGTFVVFKGNGTGCPGGTSGDLTSVRIGAGAPAPAVAWCASQGGTGSPMVTETAAGQGAIVWSLGSEGDGHLHGFDGETGVALFNGGGVNMTGLRRFATPIAAKGRIYAAGTDNVYAFTTQ